jgi:cytoskeletal protein CcmA (bactofilin family)
MAVVETVSASIGKSVQVRGEVKGSEDLIVEGFVEGTITIGPQAKVQADVSARDVVILGELNGNINASGRVELRSGATLLGDIQASRLSIEENAVFSGKVDLVQSTAAAATGLTGQAVAQAPASGQVRTV